MKMESSIPSKHIKTIVDFKSFNIFQVFNNLFPYFDRMVVNILWEEQIW